MRQIEIRWLTVLGMILAALWSVVGTALAVNLLPPVNESMPYSFSRAGENWFGQDGWQLILMAFELQAGVVAVRYFLISGRLPKLVVVLGYTLLVTASLPIIWFYLVTDWFNPHIFRITCWVGDPVGHLTVATVAFLVHLTRPTPPVPAQYLCYSLVEVLLIYPVWFYGWAVVSFFFLGFGWI